TFTVSGQVTDSSSIPLAGVTVTLSGYQAATVTSDSNGNYSFPNLPAGQSYTITAAKSYYSFTPAATNISLLTANSTANFTGALQHYSINGNVTNSNGSALSGVTVTLSGDQSATTQTDAGGNYSFNNLVAGGSYTLVATKNYYDFTPTTTINPLA